MQVPLPHASFPAGDSIPFTVTLLTDEQGRPWGTPHGGVPLPAATLTLGHLATATLRFVDSPTAALRFYAVQAQGGGYATPRQEALVSGTLVALRESQVQAQGRTVLVPALHGSKGPVPAVAVGEGCRISLDQGRLVTSGPVRLDDGVNVFRHHSQTNIQLHGSPLIVSTKAVLRLSDWAPSAINYVHVYTYGLLRPAAQGDE